MKVRVISIFIDKHTRKKYKINDEIEVSKKRYEEIKEFVEKIKKK